ncbi:hypothetical protein [Phyllobacterium endophyticum]|uniref:hypothetical protein n=1 Tax=Phyllobacterium endophyticum TaxID=1149773 RepID=UPI0011CBB655|nr:hypothetical protein [Phyllobacterium endophyticum]TXR46665.1 hypothetical protein FVA77_23820 [Phyllobacterium endophyticum]
MALTPRDQTAFVDCGISGTNPNRQKSGVYRHFQRKVYYRIWIEQLSESEGVERTSSLRLQIMTEGQGRLVSNNSFAAIIAFSLLWIILETDKEK